MNILLSRLNEGERELLLKSPLLVCILLAGADGQIDDKEVREAIDIAKEQNWVTPVLSSFYQEVAQDFEDKLKILIQTYPRGQEQRKQSISQELAQLEKLWPKLGTEFSTEYYETLRYLAKRIAASSGTMWRKISPDEAELVGLPMLVPPK